MTFFQKGLFILIGFIGLTHSRAAVAQISVGPQAFINISKEAEIQDVTSDIAFSYQKPDKTNFEEFEFSPLNNKDFNLKYSTDATWIRFNLQNPNDQRATRILFFTTFLVGELGLYEPSKSLVQIGGSGVPFDTRSFKSRLPAFKIVFEPFEKKTLYIRRTSQHSLSTRIEIADQATFFNDEADQKATLFFYAGGICCLMLFNLFIGLYTSDKDFLYYSFFAGTVALTVLDLHGVLDCYTFRYFHSNLSKYLMCFTSLSILSAIVFANRFFNLNRYMPNAKPYFKFFGCIAMSTLVYGIFFSGPKNWPYVGYLVDALLLFTLIALIFTGIFISKRGSQTAKFFLMSWAFMFLGVAAYYGVLYGILPNIPIFYSGLLFGNLGEMLIISLGLAYKLNVLNFERHQALQEASEKQHYHRLVKVLSHDVSNASFIFSSYITRLKKRISDPFDTIVIQKIETTLTKMNQILDSVRNEQAFKSFQQSVGLTNVNLREVVLDILYFYDDKLQTKKLKVETDLPTDVVVLADRSALSNQVISNILSNAIKFSNENDIIIIKVLQSEKFHKLCIQDHGVGIPQDQIQKIFFSDALISTQGTHYERGSGIGGSLIREYMKLFNGSLEVESNFASEQTGTKITLIFPRVNA